MPQEDMISQKVVTIKTVSSIKVFGILGVKLHNFKNTFHQPFWRYGNPDMRFFGNPENQILDFGYFRGPNVRNKHNLYFQGCHLFDVSCKSLVMATLNLKIILLHEIYCKTFISI